jgi:hypothetical protein
MATEKEGSEAELITTTATAARRRYNNTVCCRDRERGRLAGEDERIAGASPGRW